MWNLEIVECWSLHIATFAFYKPKEDDQDSLNQLRNCLEMRTGQKATILVLGDFKDRLWTIKQTRLHVLVSVSVMLMEILDDFNLAQMETTPRRQDHVLDLFLKT